MATLTETLTRMTEGSPLTKIPRIFSDTIFQATDLNRSHSKVLDMALRVPVTITRNNEHFALLRRELVAHMSAISDQVTLFTDVMHAIQLARTDASLSTEHPFHWLTAFDDDDLVEMEHELLTCLASVVHKEDVEAVESAVYEWRASARVIQSGVLADAFTAESDPVPLTPPPDGDSDE